MKKAFIILLILALGFGVFIYFFSKNSNIEVPEIQNIKLYVYDAKLDNAPGGPACTSRGIIGVSRAIKVTQTPLFDSIAVLIKGELQSDEIAKGYTTLFPISGLVLKSANISSSTAILVFEDPQNKTGGGACKVSILRAEIEATAKQFGSVTEVKILPEELFQP